MNKEQEVAVDNFRSTLLHFAEVGLDPNFAIAILMRYAAEIGCMCGIGKPEWMEIAEGVWPLVLESNLIEKAMQQPAIEE